MISILKKPDFAVGATEKTDFRFEEDFLNDVKYEYSVGEDSAKITVYPSGSPVKYLKLRFNGDFQKADKVYGDEWERVGIRSFLEWRSVMPCRIMPWFCYVKEEDRILCYGVKTGPNCFVSFQVDQSGLTLFLDLTCGSEGTDLQEPIVACEVVELFGDKGEDAYKVAKRFAKKMANKAVLPKEPIFGVNNWYWAYGDISYESVIQEAEYLKTITVGCKHRPYLIIDDGWQKHRWEGGIVNPCIGGAWLPGDRFKDMAKTAEEIHKRGFKTGLWIRPLLTLEDVPEEAVLAIESGGKVLDPTHPFTIDEVENTVLRIKSWGYDLIKHDFSTIDILGLSTLTADQAEYSICKPNRKFHDKTKTSAMVIKDLYRRIQSCAGDMEVIGCNTVSHLTAGIHSVYRIGNDTSGRAFEWTHRDGVNSIMRLPLNNVFYNADPDCAPFTERVKFQANLDYLEMCAITGMTTLASIKPGLLTEEQKRKINEVFLLADKNCGDFGILDYDKTACPQRFISGDGKIEKRYDWTKVYNGSRIILDWFN